MTLRARVNEALKEAMRQKDAERLSTLRLINAAIKDRDIAMRGDGEEGRGVDDRTCCRSSAKMVRQRQESARAYEEGGRLELAERERDEIEVIEEFLPRPLDEAETSAAVDEAIARTRPNSIRDMGRVMGDLKGRYTGRMDFGKVGTLVKRRLA